MAEFFYKAITIAIVVCVLAYFIPGLVLRAIRDFKQRYSSKKKGG